MIGINLLLTHSEFGPIDEYMRGEKGPGLPSRRTISGEIALGRDEHTTGIIKTAC
jgi:hypothetical protein